ncbi:MAG: adenylylsulfate reductase, partial [Deltaproteobacteria bacterium]|nr:adenylylsulfate reductase [Deltaproteobacteria bacterium]
GLFAAGDVAGGCPQKYVSGAMAEGSIAAEAALDYISHTPPAVHKARSEFAASFGTTAGANITELSPEASSLFTADQLEAAMQETMDAYAGGISRNYCYNRAGLEIARKRILELGALSHELHAADMRELLKIYELRERLVLCRCLIAHLEARKETRWPGFSRYQDYPERAQEGQAYVNSQLLDGEIKIIYRKLLTEDSYEHSH